MAAVTLLAHPGTAAAQQFGGPAGFDPQLCVDTTSAWQPVLLAVDLIAALVFFVVLLVFDKKRWLPAGLPRVLVPLVFFGLAAGALVVTQRPMAETVRDCIDLNFQQYLLLGGHDSWIHGLVLGFLPTLAGGGLLTILRAWWKNRR